MNTKIAGISTTNSQRGRSTLVILCMLLLFANFCFDLIRRMNFEDEKVKIHKILENEVQPMLDKAIFIVGAQSDKEMNLESFFTQANTILGRANEILDKVFRKVDALEAQRTSNAILAEAAFKDEKDEAEGSVEEGLPKSVDLERIFDLPLEEIQKKMDEAKGDNQLHEAMASIDNPDSPNAAKLIDYFQNRYRQVLSSEEIEFVKDKVEVYNNAGLSTKSLYYSKLYTTISERILSENYEEVNRLRESYKEPIPEEKIAEGGVGNKTFIWEKGKYPELYRLILLKGYISVAMIEDIDRYFSERIQR